MRKNINRLTEKRMANRKFWKNEEKILKVFYEGDNYASAEEVAKRAGVARSTFYRHHRAVRMIIPDYRRYILLRHRKLIRRLVRNSASIKVIYVRMIYSILLQKRFFEVLVKNGGRSIFIDMVMVVKPKIRRYARLSRNNEKMLSIYVVEVTELIYEWFKAGVKEENIEKLVENIIYLTYTIKIRLEGLEA